MTTTPTDPATDDDVDPVLWVAVAEAILGRGLIGSGGAGQSALDRARALLTSGPLADRLNALARVEALHRRIEPPDLEAGFCTGCDLSFPCPTIRTVRGDR